LIDIKEILISELDETCTPSLTRGCGFLWCPTSDTL